MNPRYPIYIPSKGRWESRLTVKALDAIKVPYKIVVEPSEYDNYAAVINPKKILVLPEDNMKLIGSRCWIMEDSIKKGFERHWQLDDNISGFLRLNRNMHYPVASGTIFRCAEDFTDRYTNVAYSGFQYDFFSCRKEIQPAIYINTRIYSCTLVNNAIPYRWRSIYNDDTDVCLMALKDKWCTILFQVFAQIKAKTMTIKGGNTEELYLIKDGRLKMAEALKELHPNLTEVVWKFNRWQHSVNYKPFQKNRLIRKPGLIIPKGVNNYGMILVDK
ncbi:MAG: hypothetical protein WC827_03680 [Candidatus Paceibacterota bacterium]|jgi:hypothetical protein